MRDRYFQLILLGFLCSFAVPSQAQDWKSVYDKAVSLYQEQKYDEALSQGQRAYTLSKSLDSKNQAFTLQLLTSICVESNKVPEGISWIAEEENLFKKIDGPQGKDYAEALRKHAVLLVPGKAYGEALDKCQAAMTIMKFHHEEKSLVYANLQSLEGQLYVLVGKLPEAKKTLDESLLKLATYPEAGEDLVNTLTVSAGVDRKLNELPSAEKKYRRLQEILKQNGLEKTPAYGEASTALAEILLQQGNTLESQSTIQNESVNVDQKASQLLKIAIDYHNRKQYDKALETYHSAEKTVEDARLVNNTAFSIYLNYGSALLEVNDPEKAAIQLEKANLLCQKLYPSGALEHALVDFATADLNMKQNHIETAFALYMKGASGAGNLPLMARKQFALKSGIELLNNNQNEYAARFLTAMGADRIDQQSVHEQPELILLYAQVLLRSNQFSKAQSILQHSISFSGNESARADFELAFVQGLEKKGYMEKALTLLNQMQARPSLKEHQKTEVAYQKARMQQLMGHYPEAEKGYRNIILTLQTKSDNDQLLLQCYNSLAVLQTQLGNYDEAEILYNDLLNKKGLSSEFMLTVRENLAAIYEESLQLEKSRELMEAVVAEERMRGNQSPEFAITLQNLATLYQKTGDLKSAKQLLEEAIKIDTETLGNQSASCATKMANLGVVQQQLGNLKEAQRLFQQALQIHEKTLGKEHPDYMFNAYNLAVSLQQAKQPLAAAPLFKEVSQFYRKQIRELFPAMSEKEKAAFFNKINEVILAYLDFAIENYQKIPELRGELFDFRLNTKALLYNASVKIRNTILSSGDTLLLARFTEWQKVKEDLGALSQRSAQEKVQASDEIRSLNQRANDLEIFLSERSASFNTETQQTSVDWKKIKSHLQKGQAVVEMIRLRLNLKNDSVIYAALILRPETDLPEIVVLRHGNEMEGRDFFYYSNSIKYLIRNERSYNMYWKPLEEKLSGVHTVFFSPDGVYNKINVMTLLNTRTNTYVVETLRVKLVNNSRELLSVRKHSDSKPVAALFGRPDFNTGFDENSITGSTRTIDDIEGLVANGIADLPGTEEEVNKISTLLKDQKWQVASYLGNKSTEQAIAQQKGVRVLHIATHGFFIPGDSEKDPIMLAPDFRQSTKNPLLRSGLILSGARRAIQLDPSKRNFSEDGVLTAYEVMNLNLDQTELVVLSACETGAGEIRNGEGIFGLQRAFLLAGSRNLVMSLWKVDDEATQQLMTEFYRQWIISNDKYEAFYKTMISMKNSLIEPYYWGSFALIGSN